MKPLLEWVEPEIPASDQQEAFSRQVRLRLAAFLMIMFLTGWSAGHISPVREPLPFWLFLPLAGLGTWMLLWPGGRLVHWISRRWPAKIKIFPRKILRVQSGGKEKVVSLRAVDSYFWYDHADVSRLVLVCRGRPFYRFKRCASVNLSSQMAKKDVDAYLKGNGISETPDSERNACLQPFDIKILDWLLRHVFVAYFLLMGTGYVVVNNLSHFRPYGAFGATLVIFGIPGLYLWTSLLVLERRALKKEKESKPI